MQESQKKTIVQHYLYSGLGGPGNVFFSLVEADASKEYDYRAVFCGIEDLREEYKNNCLRMNIPYTYLRKNRGMDFGAYFKIFRIFHRNKPSVIFLHGVSFSIVSAFWYKLTRPRTRILVRDTQAHHLKSRFEWWWMFFCLLLAKRIVVLTPASAAGLKKKFGWFARDKKLVVISNGLDMDKYTPVRIVPAPAMITIGMQSRLQTIKDHPTLLRAFKIAKEKNPQKNLSLQIAGDGETRNSIEALIDELGLRDTVKMHGMLNEKELFSFMQTLDLYVHATFGETLSNSIMQAMAFGLPVIASDVWGVNNMIANNSNGLLYKRESAGELAEKIQELISDDERRKRLGETARRFAEEHYSNKKMFRLYNQQYA